VARRLASRLPVAREAVGIAAYHAGQWQTAIAELRAYHRMSGRVDHLAILADCERALGRPERAIDIFRTADQSQLGPAEAVELLIVASGARGDLGQHDAAVAMLQVPQLASKEPWAARLRYAYADALLAVDRTADARDWFARAAEIDEESATDAADRLLELDGVVLEGDEETEESDDSDERNSDDTDGDDTADGETIDKTTSGGGNRYGVTGDRRNGGGPSAAGRSDGAHEQHSVSDVEDDVAYDGDDDIDGLDEDLDDEFDEDDDLEDEDEEDEDEDDLDDEDDDFDDEDDEDEDDLDDEDDDFDDDDDEDDDDEDDDDDLGDEDDDEDLDEDDEDA